MEQLARGAAGRRTLAAGAVSRCGTAKPALMRRSRLNLRLFSRHDAANDKGYVMEAERLNAITNALADLERRCAELRRFL